MGQTQYYGDKFSMPFSICELNYDLVCYNVGCRNAYNVVGCRNALCFHSFVVA